MAAIFTGEEISGTKIRAGRPSRRAASATATPWLPPDAAVTPAAGTTRESRLLKAPRALNEPACWSSSSLKVTSAEPDSPASAERSGVRRT